MEKEVIWKIAAFAMVRASSEEEAMEKAQNGYFLPVIIGDAELDIDMDDFSEEEKARRTKLMFDALDVLEKNPPTPKWW